MKRAPAVLIALLFTGCMVVVGQPDSQEQVARLELKADNLGALLATSCVNKMGENSCSRYPNPLECDRLDVTIKRNGATCAVCMVKGQVRSNVCGGVADGIPVVCHAPSDLSCTQCLDVYGNTVLDSCNRGTQLYRARGGSWGQDLPEGSGFLQEGDDVGQKVPDPLKPDKTPPPPPTQKDTKCDPNNARQRFAQELNKILQREGLGMSYSPVLGKKLNLKKGFWGFAGAGTKKDMCKYWLANNSYFTQCWSNEPGKCHCRKQYGNRQKCRCARVNIAALRATCMQIPPDCDYKDWVGAIVIEYGVASAWLTKASYAGGFFGQLPFMPKQPGVNNPPVCLGSPLVLDLGDDGITPSSLEQGVAFDLLGQGKQRTAWVSGNDALLTLDRNGNGVVDGGGELFGEATDVGGAPAEDGFHALAALDRPSMGGNGNGLVEAGDLMFDQLRVWTDRDSDGASSQRELSSLEAAGVQAIDIAADRTVATTDAHGNDLSLRGRFIRADGRRGLMVDVLFRVGPLR